MKTTKQPKQKEQETPKERLVYEAPAVIHESLISTRAGSPFGNPNDNDTIDPADLFGR
jgi:hypothetical protein